MLDTNNGRIPQYLQGRWIRMRAAPRRTAPLLLSLLLLESVNVVFSGGLSRRVDGCHKEGQNEQE
jgi:hypothetical protein